MLRQPALGIAIVGPDCYDCSMSNYGYANEAGEPIMDGAAYRYEQYIDSMYEPDPDAFYDRWDNEPDYVDPSECEHGDRSYRGMTVECDSGCESIGLCVVKVDIFETDESIDDVIVWDV